MFPTWGSWYDSQYCSNSSRADWWSPGTTCQYGEEGGFLCACDYDGWVRICSFCLFIHNHYRCNFDQHSVGYIPMRDRLLPIFFFVLWVSAFILCCLCCCRCCCTNNKNRWRTFLKNYKEKEHNLLRINYCFSILDLASMENRNQVIIVIHLHKNSRYLWYLSYILTLFWPNGQLLITKIARLLPAAIAIWVLYLQYTV